MHDPSTAVADPKQPQKAPEPPRIHSTIFTAFGIGKSYLFYVEKESRGKVRECWKDVFPRDDPAWEFARLSEYDKPLGEIVSLNLAACPEAQSAIANLKQELVKSFPTLECDKVDAFFFTAGVGVLVMRVTTATGANTENLYNRLQTKEGLGEVSEKRKAILKLCQKRYVEVMQNAQAHKSQPGTELQWSLYHLKAVDRSEWKSMVSFSYPLLFVDSTTYTTRTTCILEQVAGEQRRSVQSAEARISYKGSEVYVDWSEALVSDGESNRQLIENNFIVAFASWCALLLMNRNSSVFLLEAFAGMNSQRPHTSAEAVHQRNMAYKDVADAILPVRWTTRRRDLFLLETIHHNWSSERIRQNIDERMKLLALHYTRLDDERREHFSLKIAVFGVGLTLLALVSAITDLTTLASNYEERPAWLILGMSLNKVSFHLSWILLLLVLIGLVIAWLTKTQKAPTT